MKLRPIACAALAGSAVLLAGCESFETARDRDPGGAYYAGSFDRKGLGAGHLRDGRSQAREVSANACH